MWNPGPAGRILSGILPELNLSDTKSTISPFSLKEQTAEADRPLSISYVFSVI